MGHPSSATWPWCCCFELSAPASSPRWLQGNSYWSCVLRTVVVCLDHYLTWPWGWPQGSPLISSYVSSVWGSLLKPGSPGRPGDLRPGWQQQEPAARCPLTCPPSQLWSAGQDLEGLGQRVGASGLWKKLLSQGHGDRRKWKEGRKKTAEFPATRAEPNVGIFWVVVGEIAICCPRSTSAGLAHPNKKRS